MEHADGMNFHQAVLKGGCSKARGLEVIRAVGRTLAFAHTQGIIHRDVKPATILLGKDQNIKLTDFDLVHVADS